MNPLTSRILVVFSLAFLLGCSSMPELPKVPFLSGKPLEVSYDVMARTPEEMISYENQVAPILEKRCVVCHGCYDAPCQLKMNSYSGIKRGVNPEKVYDGARFLSLKPTRLGVDAKSTQEWRKKGFAAILNEGPVFDSEENLKNSLMYHALRLKQFYPQPLEGKLPEEVQLGLDRPQVCPDIKAYGDFSRKNPMWGMPYGMPNLTDREYQTLVHWIAQGSHGPESSLKDSKDKSNKVIEQWEAFFNGEGAKKKLVARYIYEHLFLGHLYFPTKGSHQTFYRLVRAKNRFGFPVDEIATVRPYDEINDPFFYRLKELEGSIVAKNHIPYRLDESRLRRFKSLFWKPDYRVDPKRRLDEKQIKNPFMVFSEIPAKSRYQFLLDDSQFFIQGFIKGPVCRGQIALDVIEDHFWVFFADPDFELSSSYPDYLKQIEPYLSMPLFRGDEMPLLDFWTDYWDAQKMYMSTRTEFLKKVRKPSERVLIEHIWNGDGFNENASLTVFRHFDSASVRKGLAGEYPETAWVIDYPLFERIHYLLVAGFNVFGNLGHQLNTRVYMDFLRMDGENHFLSYLPKSKRAQIRQYWYQGMRESFFDKFRELQDWLDLPTNVEFKSQNFQSELYAKLEERLSRANYGLSDLHRCPNGSCSPVRVGLKEKSVDLIMREVGHHMGENLKVVPDVAYVRVKMTGEKDLAYSLIRNKAYKNVTYFFEDMTERDRSDISKDTLTVIKGVEGVYPNFFYVVKERDLRKFLSQFNNIHSEKDYEKFVGLYGVRRTSSEFWQHADWFHYTYRSLNPIEAGVLDLNRYENR